MAITDERLREIVTHEGASVIGDPERVAMARELLALRAQVAAPPSGEVVELEREVVEAAKGWLSRYEEEVRDPSEEAPCKRLVHALDALAQATEPPAAPPSGEAVERLATWIMEHVPGEPSRSEGAIDTAIRLLAAWQPAPPAAPEGRTPPAGGGVRSDE